MPTRQGSFRLFRLFGIDVYLHWIWFLYAAYRISTRDGGYTSMGWNALEFLTIFSIVLVHEFGHALACKSVGGKADFIVLWLFGGVAYVAPPQRPGATLWSIAAGPLVNVVLVPVLEALRQVSRSLDWKHALPNLATFVFIIWFMNLLMLGFNLLPIYPLDGGQILRSLLWYAFGRARSLMIACVIGFIGVAVMLGLAVWWQSWWIGVLCLLIVVPNCWQGFQQAQALLRLAKAPRHEGFACPSCLAAPVKGEFWVCGQCRKAFDTFVTQGVCPQCATQFPTTACLECGRKYPMAEWMARAR